MRKNLKEFFERFVTLVSHGRKVKPLIRRAVERHSINVLLLPHKEEPLVLEIAVDAFSRRCLEEGVWKGIPSNCNQHPVGCGRVYILGKLREMKLIEQEVYEGMTAGYVGCGRTCPVRSDVLTEQFIASMLRALEVEAMELIANEVPDIAAGCANPLPCLVRVNIIEQYYDKLPREVLQGLLMATRPQRCHKLCSENPDGMNRIQRRKPSGSEHVLDFTNIHYTPGHCNTDGA